MALPTSASQALSAIAHVTLSNVDAVLAAEADGKAVPPGPTLVTA